MFWLDKIVLNWFNGLFNGTNILGYEVGKFTFLSICGIAVAELYNIKNKFKGGVK